MTSKFLTALQTVRFNNWWQYKIPPLFAIFFITKITELKTVSRVNDWLQLTLLFCWMFAAASFGYFVNDFSDIEEDNLAGKRNLVQRIPYGFRILVFFLLGLTVIAFQLMLNHSTSIAFQLSLIQLAVFVAYSVRPVRLKERYFLGALCDALYAHILPASVVFLTVIESPKGTQTYLFGLMILWQMLQGVRNILIHHLQDAVNDVKSGANNLATRFGQSRLEFWALVIAPVEALAGFLFFYTVSRTLLLWLGVAFVAVWLLRFLLTLNDGRKFYIDINKQNITLWTLNGFYEQIMPPIAILYYMHLRSYEGFLFFVVMALYFLVFPVFMANFISHITSTTLIRIKILFYDMPKSYLITTYWKFITWYWKQYTAYWKRQHEKNPNIRYNFCTVSSTDHLYKVMALHDSLIRQSSKARLHVLLTDTGIVDYTKFPDSVILYKLTQVKSQPHAELILSKYAHDSDRVRWCMKPVFMRYLLSTSITDSVLYIDNDICFFNAFIPLFDYVGKFGVWLTPHWRCMNPFDDAHVFTDNFTDGMFNAGFIGATMEGLHILEWWSMVNSYRCEKNRAEGMWDDQKYLDMLPVRFSNVGIVRHMGCNVAVWNKRDCIRTPHLSGVRICDEFPIIFIHFTKDTMEDIRADKYGGDPLLKPYLDQYQQRIDYYKTFLSE